MAYTPTVWETGDVITAEKLNKAENGIAAAATYFDLTDVEPFDLGDIVIDMSGGPSVTAYPVPSEALADGSIVLLSAMGDHVQISELMSFETEVDASQVERAKYLLPPGTKVRKGLSVPFVCLYDESVTPIPGEKLE